MDPLSKRSTLVRYSAVLFAMYAVALGLRIIATGLSLGAVVMLAVFAIICLKYPLFDAVVRVARRRWPKLKVLPWLWIGYGAAVFVDVVATWLTYSDEGGASLALAMTILLSPWLLAAALLLMILHTLAARRR